MTNIAYNSKLLNLKSTKLNFFFRTFIVMKNKLRRINWRELHIKQITGQQKNFSQEINYLKKQY